MAKQIKHKSFGKKTGLGVCAWFAFIFEFNELCEQAKKITDDEILARAKKEFPNRKVWESFDAKRLTVNAYRKQYLRGDFTMGIVPEKYSFRYDSDGDAVEGRRGWLKLSKAEVAALNHQHLLSRKKHG